MDFIFDREWRSFLKKEFDAFGLGNDIDSSGLEVVLFILGIQIVGLGNKNYTKTEKLHLMHVATSTVLTPYGYYKHVGEDKDGWPHFELHKELPALHGEEQERFLKEAIMNYFEEN